MNLTQPSFGEITVDGLTLKVKLLTSREYSEFQRLQEVDALKGVDYVLKTSLENVTDEILLDVPMKRRGLLFRAIIKANAVDGESTEEAVKN